MINSNQFSLRLTDEQKARLNELYPDLSVRDIFCILFENNEKQPEQPDNSEFLKQIESLENNSKDFMLQIENYIAENEQLKNKVAELETREPEVVEQRVEVAIEKERELSANELLLTLPEPCRRLLNEYAKRLRTTAENILIYTFFRYCVERYALNIWDYSVIKKAEFEEVCGLSYSEIKELL